MARRKTPTSKAKPKAKSTAAAKAVQTDDIAAAKATVEDAVIVEDSAAPVAEEAVETTAAEAVADADVSEVVAPVEDTAAAVEIDDTPADERWDWKGPEDGVPVAPVPAPAPRRRGGFIPLVLGGVVAAGIGFGTARYLVPEGWPIAADTTATDAISADVAALNGRIDAVSDRVAEGDAAVRADVDALSGTLSTVAADATAATEAAVQAQADQLAAMETALAAQSDTLDGFKTRLTEIEKRPITEAGDEVKAAVAAYEAEIAEMRTELAAKVEENAAFRAELDAMSADVDARLAETKSMQDAAEEQRVAAEAARKTAVTRAALGDLALAIEAGKPFGAAMDALAAEGVELPEALAAAGADGVPEQSVLVDGFPDAARAALAASQTIAEDASTGDKLAAFFQSRTGARSLTPQEGDSPDAVLSRAEAAVRDGNIAAALDLIGQLPEDGQAALADWRAQAEARASALAAYETLNTALSSD